MKKVEQEKKAYILDGQENSKEKTIAALKGGLLSRIGSASEAAVNNLKAMININTASMNNVSSKLKEQSKVVNKKVQVPAVKKLPEESKSISALKTENRNPEIVIAKHRQKRIESVQAQVKKTEDQIQNQTFLNNKIETERQKLISTISEISKKLKNLKILLKHENKEHKVEQPKKDEHNLGENKLKLGALIPSIQADERDGLVGNYKKNYQQNYNRTNQYFKKQAVEKHRKANNRVLKKNTVAEETQKTDKQKMLKPLGR